ncbi:transmembrane protease serine 11D-like [Phlebotomus papatasi]|uniref:transmembrane protease serine 11D-like n=1 Tax=Phlebotomus papatasi TaxID=29031 RepID=UPI002483583E|nr:transmembrane protease serine 11D-like [Phlebotomus papatasi]
MNYQNYRSLESNKYAPLFCLNALQLQNNIIKSNLEIFIVRKETVSQILRHEIYAEIGKRDLYQTPENVVKLEEFHILTFDTATYEKDIALIRLPDGYRDLPSNIVLPEITIPVEEYKDCSIFGYGSERFLFPIIASLREAPIEIISAEDCEGALNPYAPDYDSGMFCAGRGVTDACQGDSGSGLICDGGILVGIVSYGSSCGVPGLPGVYTNVQYHREWIEKQIAQGNI